MELFRLGHDGAGINVKAMDNGDGDDGCLGQRFISDDDLGYRFRRVLILG